MLILFKKTYQKTYSKNLFKKPIQKTKQITYSTNMLTSEYNHICPIEGKMLSDGETCDINSYHFRNKLPETVQLLNWNRNSRGWVNHRDGPILGKHPGITNSVHAEQTLISIYLNHDMDEKVTTKFCKQYKMPTLLNKQHVSGDDRMRNKMPIGAHQQWISSNDATVHWKKRPWELSRNFRDMSGTKFPTFVIVLTPCINGILRYEQSTRTTSFEICSKDQPNVSNFERGDAITTSRRRTPETERANAALRAIQADILRIRDETKNQEEIATEYEMRTSFGLAIAKSDPSAQKIVKSIQFYQKRIARIFAKC